MVKTSRITRTLWCYSHRRSKRLKIPTQAIRDQEKKKTTTKRKRRKTAVVQEIMIYKKLKMARKWLFTIKEKVPSSCRQDIDLRLHEETLIDL